MDLLDNYLEPMITTTKVSNKGIKVIHDKGEDSKHKGEDWFPYTNYINLFAWAKKHLGKLL